VYSLIAVALASNLALLVDAAGKYSSPAGSNFDIVQYESRFAAVRQDIPRHEVIGYLTDADANLTSTLAEYYLAQLALVPTVVAQNTEQNLVIANVHTPQPPAFYQQRGLELVKDYGNGVMLLRRIAR
jgi:hypothetical protein